MTWVRAWRLSPRVGSQTSPFQLGDTVTHPVFGEGKIVGALSEKDSDCISCCDGNSVAVLRTEQEKQYENPRSILLCRQNLGLAPRKFRNKYRR